MRIWFYFSLPVYIPNAFGISTIHQRCNSYAQKVQLLCTFDATISQRLANRMEGYRFSSKILTT